MPELQRTPDQVWAFMATDLSNFIWLFFVSLCCQLLLLALENYHLTLNTFTG